MPSPWHDKPAQLHAKDADALLYDLQAARKEDAAYYIELVQVLQRRCNDLEGCPDRSLGDLLRDAEAQNDAARRYYPPDDVILAEPTWRSMCPAGEGWTCQAPLTLAESLQRVADRCQ